MPKKPWFESLKERVRSRSPAPRQNAAVGSLTGVSQAAEPSISATQAIQPSTSAQQTEEFRPTLALSDPCGIAREKYGLFRLASLSAGSLANDTSLDKDPIDIIAVHGLNGTAYGTWTHDNGNFWLEDLRNDFPGARVFTYGYASELYFTRGTGNIDTFSRSLLEALKRERTSKKDQARRIIFICHSMGGIVVKKALVTAIIDHWLFDNITKSVAGIAFLSTPHRGSSQADLPLVLANVANFALFGTARIVGSMRSDLVRSLEKDSLGLKDISTNFRNQTQNINIASFTEQETTPPANKRIVDETSGIMDVARERIVPMHGCDHRSVCRFSGRDSEGYKIVLGVLQDWVNDINEAQNKVITADDLTCLGSLSFPEINYRQQEADQAYQNTCAWILTHGVYTEWLAKNCEVLWLQGDPGSGKSTLMSFIYLKFHRNELLKGEVVLDYFFHGRGTPLQKTRVGMFRSLLHQLYTQVHFIRPQIRALFKEKEGFGNAGIGWDWHPKECEHLFSEVIVSASQSKSITLFVDALDEAGADVGSDLESYFHELSKKLRAGNCRARICISCRRYPILAPNDGLKISIEEENNEDIKTYVEQNLDFEIQSHGIATLTSKEFKKLRKEVVKRSRNTFQWACLVVPLIIKLRRDGQSLAYILEELNKVPQELSKVYEHILTEVIELRNRPRTLLLMQWVYLAESPLTVADIRFAMASDDAYIDERRQSCSDSKDFVESDERMQTLVTSMSGGLVETISHKHNGSTVQHIDRPVNNGSIVQFIHQSINDFLLSGGLKFLAQYQSPTARDDNELSSSAIIGQSHDRLCKSCINYLKLEDVSTIYESSFPYRIRPPSQPFFRYATQYWLVHAEEAERYGVSQQYLIQRLGLRPDQVFFDWEPTYRRIGPRWVYGDPFRPSLLHIASIANIRSVAIQILEADSLTINDRDFYWNVPLYYASICGHWELVKVLLDAEDPIGVISKDRTTKALIAAVEQGHEQVVRQLLGRGADVSVNTVMAGSALVAAVKATTQTLPAERANIRHIGTKKYAKKARAMADIDVIKLLLDHGANANSRGDDNLTAIQEAITSPVVNTAAVDLLLERGADANASCAFTVRKEVSMEWYPRTQELLSTELNHRVIHVAVALEDKDTAATVTKLLLKKGARINEIGIHGTPIWIASTKGNIYVVELLLKYGADADELRGSLLTLLQVASEQGHPALVKFLLEKGPSGNLQQHGSPSSVQLAASRSDTNLIEPLSDNGANSNAPARESVTELQALSANWMRWVSDRLVPQLLENAMKPKEQQRSFNDELRESVETAKLELSMETAKLLRDSGADISGPFCLFPQI